VPTVNFRLLFDLSPNPYMLLDRDLRYVAANPAYVRATGTSLENLIGRYIFEVFPNDPEDSANESAVQLRESLRRVIATGEADTIALIPYRVPRIVDGRTVIEDRYWSATHTPVLDDQGKVTFVLQHTVDVTELHHPPAQESGGAEQGQLQAGVLRRAQQVQQANVVLETERQHLRRLFEQAPGFIAFVRGPQHVFEIANHAYYQVVGHREIIGRPVRDALPEVAGQGFFELLDQVYQTGEAYVGRDVRMAVQRTPGGPLDELYLDFVYQPIVDASGSIGVFVQGHDITDQRRLETELQVLLQRERAARAKAEASEAQQRFLADSIPQQIWTATPDGNLDFVNRRVAEYFDTASVDILGRGWEKVIHPEDLARCVERWSHSVRTGEEYDVEFRLRSAAGGYRWHIGRALALHDDEGRIVKWFGTNTDVDDVRRARDELQSRAEYEEQIIGIVSHDLRNPLNVIAMAGSLLLQRGRLDDQQGKTVARIVSATERAVHLIKDFLDFTQSRSTGRMPVHPTDANICELARQVFDDVHLVYPDRHATIRHDGIETGWWDPNRLLQLLTNIIGNAFQHSPEDGSVSVVTRGSDDEVVIEVRNDGDPIPPEHLPRLFEPFERGAGARSSSERSLGLGLFISKQIVLAHGGRIDVRSTAGEGTTFTVTLPRRTTVPPAD
jgi:PAS domain S-box-containing protein